MEIIHKTKPDGLNARQVLLFSRTDVNIVGNGFFTPNLDILILYNSKGELIDYVTQQPVNEGA